MTRLLAGVGLALALAACASTPSPRTATGGAPASALACGSGAGGVRLADGAQQCAFSRVYGGDDLRRTGAQHVGDALTQVDSGLSPVH